MANQKVAAFWIFGVGVAVAAAGLFLAVIVPAFFPGIMDLFYWSFAQSGSVMDWPQPMLRHLDWLYGLIGAIMLGWGISLALLAWRLFTENAAWIWRTILVSVLAWFIVDTGISLFYQVMINVALNCSILVLALVPYVMRRAWQK